MTGGVRGEGGGGVEAAVAVLSRLESGRGQCMQLGAPQSHCIGVGTGDGLGAAGGGCLLQPGVGAHHTGDELN